MIEDFLNDDFEFCGYCCVCDEAVDLSDMGNCGSCGSVFHWDRCGDWGYKSHMCNSCKQDED